MGENSCFGRPNPNHAAHTRESTSFNIETTQMPLSRAALCLHCCDRRAGRVVPPTFVTPVISRVFGVNHLVQMYMCSRKIIVPKLLVVTLRTPVFVNRSVGRMTERKRQSNFLRIVRRATSSSFPCFPSVEKARLACFFAFYASYLAPCWCPS